MSLRGSSRSSVHASHRPREGWAYNHRAEQVKAALLLKGDQRIAVINVPWYTHEVGLDHWQAAPR